MRPTETLTVPKPTAPGWWYAHHIRNGWELVFIVSVEGRVMHIKRLGRTGSYAGHAYYEYTPANVELPKE